MYPTGEPPWGHPGTGGFLGMAHNPFRLVDRNVTRRRVRPDVERALEHVDRVGLLRNFDAMNRTLDRSGTMDGMDGFGQQASAS